MNSATWSWAHYREAAYRLGTWQGPYATGEQALPACDWLSRSWLQQWVGLPLVKIVELLDRSGAWEMPVVRAHFSAQEIAQVRHLWAERERHWRTWHGSRRCCATSTPTAPTSSGTATR